MKRNNRNINYTEYAIEWMKTHEAPLPPDAQIALESIPSYLNKKMGERDLSTAQLFEAAGTERSTGYKIMNGQLLPSRDSLLPSLLRSIWTSMRCNIRSCYGPAKEVLVPERYLGLPVRAVYQETFRGKAALSRILLPDSLEEIQDMAFMGCSSLRELVIPQGVTRIGHTPLRTALR